MRSRVPRKSVDFESIDLGDSLYSYPPGTNPNNLAPYKVPRSLALHLSISLLDRPTSYVYKLLIFFTNTLIF